MELAYQSMQRNARDANNAVNKVTIAEFNFWDVFAIFDLSSASVAYITMLFDYFKTQVAHTISLYGFV